MKNLLPVLLVAGTAALLAADPAFATNPLIMDQFTADPTARVFEGKLYVYPSHDIPPIPGKTRPDWFCMQDYHVFSSENLTDWTDHGVILRQQDVPWANPTAYAMWAPDCVTKAGKYYFFFPAIAKSGGFHIGVAIADQPYGPFRPEPQPLEGVRGIDPGVFIDRDGSAYLYYAGGSKVFVAKLKDNLLELQTPPTQITTLPSKGLVEGPFVFERNGIYYLTYPHTANKTERLEYATSAHPLGPFTPAGVILDESPDGCWTVHQSIVEYRGQWYLFYHDDDLSPSFDKNRSIRADRLFFNDDGTIRKVVPTRRGVGVVSAKSKIQIDRYSAVSDPGVSVSFLDPSNPPAGWKISLPGKRTWVRFDDVDFGRGDFQAVTVRGVATHGGTLEIHLDHESGPVLGRVEIRPGSEWTVSRSPTKGSATGVHNLVVTTTGNHPVDIDWVGFE